MSPPDPTRPDPTERDPRAELLELVRATRAWVEWVHHSGVDELAALGRSDVLLRRLTEAPSPQRGAAAARRSGASSRDPQTSARPPGDAPRDGATRAQGAPPREVAARGAATPAAPPDRGEAAASASSEERRQRLAVLAEEVKRCTKCRLHASRTQTAFSRGSPDAELVFVGEGPGAEEDRQGLPFVGAAGQLLDKMIGAMGYHRDEVYIANVVKCRPPQNRKPEPDEMEACMPYLREQLELIGPKVIVALGATGVEGMLGSRAGGITRLRGTWKLYRGRIPLMPTFHPAYLLRSPEKKRDVWNDLKQVLHKLGRQAPPTKNTQS